MRNGNKRNFGRTGQLLLSKKSNSNIDNQYNVTKKNFTTDTFSYKNNRPAKDPAFFNKNPKTDYNAFSFLDKEK